MSLESRNLRDLLAGCITGNTVQIQQSTATDLIRMVVGSSGTSLNVNLIGGGGTGGTGTSGTSGSGSPGTSGTSGADGKSGTQGNDGTSGTSGANGANGTQGNDGTSGSSGKNGIDASGTSGTSGDNGTSGTSGGIGNNGSSGTSGKDGGGSSMTITNVSDASYTGTTLSTLYRCSGTTDFILPVASGSAGYLIIKNIDTTTILVQPVGVETIDGQVSKTVNQLDSVYLVDGSASNWDII